MTRLDVVQNRKDAVNINMPTLYVNLFGAPGAGKSTTAAGVFTILKLAGINAELITEYAKDLVWDESLAKLDDQLYVFGKQYHRMKRLDGKVLVAITDSPPQLGLIYAKDASDSLKDLILDASDSFTHINFYLKRVKPYNPIGRLQTEEESDAVANRVKNMLEEYSFKYTEVDGDEAGVIQVAKTIHSILRPDENLDIDFRVLRRKK